LGKSTGVQNQAEQDVAATNKKEQPDAVATDAGVVCVCVGARGERRRERVKGGRVYRRRIGRLSGRQRAGERVHFSSAGTPNTGAPAGNSSPPEVALGSHTPG